MDEAHDVGLGQYLDKHGYKNRFDILTGHLKRVTKICRDYGYKPMMWSDMFFRLGSKTHDYYDLESDIPKDKKKDIPDIELIYWDYYSLDFDFFDGMIEKHKGLNKETVFAGGIWTWNGFIPRTEMAAATTLPGLRAACKNGIKTVFATMWADNGCETNHFLAVPLLALYSEICYKGSECSEKDIYDAAEALTGMSLEFMLELSNAHGMPTEKPNRTILNPLLYGDAFYALPELGEEDRDYIPNLEKALKTAEEGYAQNGRNRETYLYYIKVLSILKGKAELRFNLRKKYIENDREYLKYASEVLLPEISKNLKDLCLIFQKQWSEVYKPFGLETMIGRFGSTVFRMDYAAEVIKEYLCGKRNKIEMLDEEVLPYKDAALLRFFKNSISASEII